MSAESDVTAVTGALALLSRITPAAVVEGPAGTATRNYLAREGGRWFVKAYPRGTRDLAEERQALALGESARRSGVPVPAVRRSVSGEVIASAGGLSPSPAVPEPARTDDARQVSSRGGDVA
ncbi:hypothetical protein [Streptomyces sp. NRRL B-24572]|uniref:hypothetical protein n=1 Tax=Streptomyces sp. NRRL B-24572 TaxID=1962156 RepID=UPI0011808A46|nr:hypothetical protein [Streptomyces sp. NRRL B-24572]